MGFLGTQNFGLISGGGGSGPPPATPDWQAVTDVGNTTTDDIFVRVGSDDYFTVDRTNNLYFLGNPLTARGVFLTVSSQTYVFGETAGPKISITTADTSFAGTDLYQFVDSVATYSTGTYKSVVLQTSSFQLQIQAKDILPQGSSSIDVVATVDQCVLLIDTTSGNINVTLPNTVLPGKRYFIKKNAGSSNVIITPASGNIDNAANYTITVLYEAIEVFFDGTDYWIL